MRNAAKGDGRSRKALTVCDVELCTLYKKVSRERLNSLECTVSCNTVGSVLLATIQCSTPNLRESENRMASAGRSCRPGVGWVGV